MEDMNLENPGRIRKIYQKPEIQCVRLVPKEAVLGICKITFAVGKTVLGCAPGGFPCDEIVS